MSSCWRHKGSQDGAWARIKQGESGGRQSMQGGTESKHQLSQPQIADQALSGFILGQKVAKRQQALPTPQRSPRQANDYSCKQHAVKTNWQTFASSQTLNLHLSLLSQFASLLLSPLSPPPHLSCNPAASPLPPLTTSATLARPRASCHLNASNLRLRAAAGANKSRAAFQGAGLVRLGVA